MIKVSLYLKETLWILFRDYRYGTKAAEATNEGLDAAGHAFGTAWVAFKIRKAFNPKNVIKPSSLAKSAVSDLKAKKGSK